FNTPQRILSCLYLKNTLPIPPGLHANLLPHIGEFFSVTGLSQAGVCEMLLFEGIPGGELDCWQDIITIEEQFQKIKEIIQQYFPWEFERFANSQITDENAGLIGKYTPKICEPLATLSSGKIILGLGDAIILNDPIAGQGANLACKSAYLYAELIAAQDKKSFDAHW